MSTGPPGAGPAVSVVIACLNAAGTLGAQLDAVASSRCDVPWEVLVVDNGSTDGTVALAAAYRGRIPGLRILDASGHRGVSRARNIGARAAVGPWLAFCDADDVVGADWLVSMVAALRRDPFVAGRFEGAFLNSARTARSRPVAQQDGLQTSPIGPGLPHAGAGNMGIDRDLFHAVGGFDETLSCLEDTDLCWRLQLAGVPLVWAPDVVIHMRLRASLWGMVRQGRAYGDAHAELAHRYPHQRAVSSADLQPAGLAAGAGLASGLVGVDGPSRVSTTALTGAGAVLAPARVEAEARWSLGRALWQLGWHVGHRTHRGPR